MGWSATFLKGHPDLAEARDRSQIWEQIRNRYALPALGTEAYVVRGDAIGDRDDLYLDALARGSERRSPDPLARCLFEELSPELRQLVLRELRKEPTEDTGI